LYIATSLALSPLLEGISKDKKTIILKKVCQEFKCDIANADVYEIFHAVEPLGMILGLILNKVIDVNSMSIARENILSNPELIEKSMKMIQDNPELIKKIQDTLSQK